MGSIAILMDPAGAAVGVWQPGTRTGFGKYNELGVLAWDELHSKDFLATAKFYREAFG